MGPTVVRREDIDLLADVGVALLLFAIGLELPLHRLTPVRHIALCGTPLQILLTIALGGLAGLRAGALVAVMVVLGTRIFPWLINRVAGWRSRELFLVATVAAGLGVGYGAHLVGLPFAFGAFLEGMVLSEAEYSHHALHDIGPLRDVFGMLFVASVGMLLDPTALPRAGGLAAALTVAAASMALTPVAAEPGPRLHVRRERARGGAGPAPPATPLPRRGSHVVIAGYGRVGRFVCQVLQQLGHPFVVVDLDPAAVAAAREAGFDTIYGDGAAPAVLEAAGVRDARLVILTMPDPVAAPVAVERIRLLNPETQVAVRAVGLHQLEELRRLGVYEAVLPDLEAALELVRQVLVHLEIERGDIQPFVDRLRRDYYAPLLRSAADDSLLDLLRHTARLIEVEWYQLPEESPLAGLSIGALKVRERTGASVVAVVRGDEVIPNAGPDVVLQTSDTVGLMGTRSQREAFRALAEGTAEPGGD